MKARRAPKLPRSTVRPLKLPRTYESVTSSGLTVIAAPRGPIPLVSIRLVIQGGSSMDPADKPGLADFTARLLRRGAGALDADALDEAVEFVGGALGVGASEDEIDLAITAPADHAPQMLEILARMVKEPHFAPDEVDSARERTAARLANELDDPAALAEAAFVRVLWGDHPYGHSVPGTPTSVQTFTREDVVRFHRERLGPKVALLVVVGDLDPEKIHSAAERAFAGWSGGPDRVQLPPPLERAAGAGQVLVIDKPDQSQSQVRLGAMTLKKRDPDYHAALMASTILGSGFTSRLVDEVRVNRGLSYGVSSYLGPLRGGSILAIETFTKTSSTREIIDVSWREVEKLRSKGVGAKELEGAKTYFCGLYPLRLETNEAVAGGIAEIRLSELGDDWVERYRERVMAVSRADVLRAARAHLFPIAPAIVVVGRAEEMVGSLKGLGPVTVKKVAELA